MENLQAADMIARKGKSRQYGVLAHDKNRECNIQALHEMLLNKTFRTSAYKTFTVFDQKEREVFALPYFPDRIVHHAIMNVLEPILTDTFTADTYSCIKGRGIHSGARKLEKSLRDVPDTQYALQLDIRKYYPSIDHEILKAQLHRKIKDQDLLWLLDDIIDSAPGLPIGNYLSQALSNFYLSGLDHIIKERWGVKYYFRYCDDIVILALDKPALHLLLSSIRQYIENELKLQIKSNYQIFPVDAQGIDFMGYRFYHGHTKLRTSIKKRFAKAVASGKPLSTLAAYWGWAKHCNSNYLIKKLLHERV